MIAHAVHPEAPPSLAPSSHLQLWSPPTGSRPCLVLCGSIYTSGPAMYVNRSTYYSRMKRQQLFILVSFVKKNKKKNNKNFEINFLPVVPRQRTCWDCWSLLGCRGAPNLIRLSGNCCGFALSCPRTADSWTLQMVSADSRAHVALTLTHNALFQVDQWGNKRHGRLLFHVNGSI